jgi:hypothetical protein
METPIRKKKTALTQSEGELTRQSAKADEAKKMSDREEGSAGQLT